MAIDYKQLKTLNFEDRTDSYTVRDSIFYALTLGYGDNPTDENDLRFIYEKNTLVVPTLLAVVGAPGGWAMNPALGINWVKLLHGEHRMTFHSAVPPQGTVTSKTKITHVVDKGAKKGALVVSTREIFDGETTEHIATVEHVSFLRDDGGFGEGDKPLITLPEPPKRPAEAKCYVKTSPQAAALYRLNGDLNPIHIQPEMAKKAGFERPILHGLCTYGLATRALIKQFSPDKPGRLRSIAVRFSSVFFPGETLRIEAWVNNNQVQFRALSNEREVVVLDNCIAEFID
ncbi:MaoC family dehydratase [Zwartia vadi]|uniref:MaoC family dehydratase n=1 Tax=Zwartia vadi TaxID=3058168 RepID=UPI0025B5EE10|nr:MaoC family dehydratase [Zwartia vadi]MDN3988860.1 MaoC/PaaZ C-terminal domain-containing protein [Zwartia vadi]